MSPRRADHSSRGVLPSVACLSVFAKPRLRGRPGTLGGGFWGRLCCAVVNKVSTFAEYFKPPILKG